MQTIYLVSCVSKKRTMPCMAKDLYQSDWFKKARAHVEATGMPWFILSAKYGLLDPNEVAAPYEQTLNKMPIDERSAWAERVMKRLNSVVAKDDDIVILAGHRYREFLVSGLQKLVGHVSVPMEGMRIGEQLSWFGRSHGQTR